MENPLDGDPSLIGSIFDSNQGANKPPPRWGQALRFLALKIRRIELGWKGSNAQKNFEPIPGAEWEPEAPDAGKKPEDQTDRRLDGEEGIKAWAESWLLKTWRAANEKAERDGAGIVQIGLFGWTNQGFKRLTGGTIAVKCGEQAGSGDVVEIADMSAIKILAWTCTRQEKRIEFLEKQLDEHRLNADKPIKSLAAAIEATTDLHIGALKLKEQSSAAASEERDRERQWIIEILRTQQWGGALNLAVEKLGPLIASILNDFSGAPQWAKIARTLRASITTDQIEKAKQLGLSDLIDDIQKSLLAIEQAEDDETAKAIIVPMFKKVNAEQDVLKQVLTADQMELAITLFKFASE